ncbi:hypothetical protein SNEBB_007880 [Seison nebaliae]|nr:hypothetical protein SNEBB_007880 [Seison nebaliae]
MISDSSDPISLWETAWTIDEIRECGTNWSLAADAAVLLRMKKEEENLWEQINQFNEKLDNIQKDISMNEVSLNNVANRYLFLSNTKIMETKVRDSTGNVYQKKAKGQQTNQKTKEEIERIAINTYDDCMKTAVDILNVSIDKELEINESESSLPWIIGSPKFFFYDSVGLDTIDMDSTNENNSHVDKNRSRKESITSSLPPPPPPSPPPLFMTDDGEETNEKSAEKESDVLTERSNCEPLEENDSIFPQSYSSATDDEKDGKEKVVIDEENLTSHQSLEEANETMIGNTDMSMEFQKKPIRQPMSIADELKMKFRRSELEPSEFNKSDVLSSSPQQLPSNNEKSEQFQKKQTKEEKSHLFHSNEISRQMTNKKYIKKDIEEDDSSSDDLFIDSDEENDMFVTQIPKKIIELIPNAKETAENSLKKNDHEIDSEEEEEDDDDDDDYLLNILKKQNKKKMTDNSSNKKLPEIESNTENKSSSEEKISKEETDEDLSSLDFSLNNSHNSSNDEDDDNQMPAVRQTESGRIKEEIVSSIHSDMSNVSQMSLKERLALYNDNCEKVSPKKKIIPKKLSNSKLISPIHEKEKENTKTKDNQLKSITSSSTEEKENSFSSIQNRIKSFEKSKKPQKVVHRVKKDFEASDRQLFKKTLSNDEKERSKQFSNSTDLSQKSNVSNSIVKQQVQDRVAFRNNLDKLINRGPNRRKNTRPITMYEVSAEEVESQYMTPFRVLPVDETNNNSSRKEENEENKEKEEKTNDQQKEIYKVRANIPTPRRMKNSRTTTNVLNEVANEKPSKPRKTIHPAMAKIEDDFNRNLFSSDNDEDESLRLHGKINKKTHRFYKPDP